MTKLRYKDWDELIHYCSYSAMPVGRFVLDVHGESRATWAANDALCAALQINNHLQDCGKDFRELNRVYIPLDAFAAAGAAPGDLGAERASPELLRCIHDSRGAQRDAARRGRAVLRPDREHAPRARSRGDPRLCAPHRGAAAQRDPLSQRVHLSKAQFALYGLSGVLIASLRRIGRPRNASPNVRKRDA